MVRILHFHCRGPGVQPLLGELRSHKPRGAAKNKNKNIMLYYLLCSSYLTSRSLSLPHLSNGDNTIYLTGLP